MRISHRWLTELLPGLTTPVEALADRLTRLGMLVDEMVRADRGFEAVVLARVTSVAPHPAADRLKVCWVEAGAGATRQIVCGAPVVKEGAFYPLALPGARLPNGMALEGSEIHGVRSEGMLCSAPELGLDHLGDASGILELEAQGARPGAPVAPLLGLDDTVFVLEVPSNRPDWESHLGVARELHELTGDRLPSFEPGAPASDSEAAPPEGAGPVTVRLLDPEGCPLYSGRVLRRVRVGPSPRWVQQRLSILGLRPINNVVDATNYVLLELGTPLHAFDLREVRGGEIVVRRAHAGETLVTLDGKERALSPEMTVIADRERGIAIGGVMGGLESEVSPSTTEVFLEAAFFDPERVRRTAVGLGVRSEASHRFGRGVDPGAVPAGLRRAGGLICEWSGGSLEGHAVEVRAPQPPAAVLPLRLERVNALTGLRVGRAQAGRLLGAIGLEAAEPEDANDGGLRVRVPSHRFDLHREVDLVEEVARRVGYDRVPAVALPPRSSVTAPGLSQAIAELSRTLSGLGLDEVYTPTFFDPQPFGEGFFAGRLLEQSNPLAQNERFLRPSLLPTLVLAARYNLRRGAAGVRLFEIGHVFEAAVAGEGSPAGTGGERSAGTSDQSDLPPLPGIRERRMLGIVLAGTHPEHWSTGGKVGEADFYDAKGVIEAVLGPGRDLGARPSARTWLHPGQQADLAVEGRSAGFVGRLHPRVARALDLAAQVVVAELDLGALLRRRHPMHFAALSAFPRIERDVALVVPEERLAADVLGLVREAALENLVEVRLFDVYRGDQVPAGTRSLAFHLVFQSRERTLTEVDVEREMASLLARLAEAGIRIR